MRFHRQFLALLLLLGLTGCSSQRNADMAAADAAAEAQRQRIEQVSVVSNKDGHLVVSNTGAASGVPVARNYAAMSADDIKGWGRKEDPAGGTTIELQGTTLVMTTPDIYVDNYPPGKVNAPRVMQEVFGDFSIEVTVTHLDPSQPNSVLKSLGSFPTAYHAGALLVRTNEKNFIRFEKGSKNTRGDHATTCELQVWENGKRMLYVPEDIEDVVVHLRLERRDEMLLSSFSKDEGKTWKELPPYQLDKLKGAVQVGVSLTNNTEPGCTVKFQDLKVIGGINPRILKFKELDSNHDGQLNLAEFTDERKPKEAEKWFRRRDVDGNGFVSLSEFAPSLPTSMTKPESQDGPESKVNAIRNSVEQQPTAPPAASASPNN